MVFFKMQKCNKQKQCVTHFAITHAKKTVKTQGENQKSNFNAYQKVISKRNANRLRKNAKFVHTCQANLVNGDCGIFQNRKVVINFF